MKLYLNDREWKEYLISELFKISGTKTTPPSRLINGGLTPRITCAATNNGLEDTYKNDPTEKGGVITIDSATVGYVSYQPYDFIATDHVEKITLKNHSVINKYLGTFLVKAIISATLTKYDYGYKFSQSRIAKQKILLPINKSGEPDYKFMEAYMKQKEKEKLQKYNIYIKERINELKNYKEVEPLEDIEWGEFGIEDLFELSQGKSKGLNHLTKTEQGINYLGATNLNNGVLCQVDKVNKFVHRGNAIAFIRNGEGSMGYSIYKTEDFIATSDISVGYNDYLNREIGLFITTVADKVRGKYNFGYKRSAKRLKKERILLPINDQKEPDYEYMENYMKKLEYKKLKQYLEYKEL